MSAAPTSGAPDGAHAIAPAQAPAFGRRLMCAAYEFCLLFGVSFIAGYLLLTLAQWRWPLQPTQLSLLQAYMLCVIGLYFIYFWRRSGQTLAMKTWRMRLVGSQGGAPTLTQCCVRYALLWWGLLPGALVFFATRNGPYAALALLACTLVSWIWMLFDPERQFLHDRLLGTRLVRT